MLRVQFNNQYVPQNTLEIESVGNVCIEGIDMDDGLYYYLLIKTSMGTSSIFQYGPVVPDMKKSYNYYNVSYSKEQFNEKKLGTFISKWLNDKFRKISSARVIDEGSFLDNYIDIPYIINNYGEDVY